MLTSLRNNGNATDETAACLKVKSGHCSLLRYKVDRSSKKCPATERILSPMATSKHGTLPWVGGNEGRGRAGQAMLKPGRRTYGRQAGWFLDSQSGPPAPIFLPCLRTLSYRV
jgi:hypothetical protein